MPYTLRGDDAGIEQPGSLPPSMLTRQNVLRGLLCAVVVIVCLLTTWPFASMGMVDDWSYIKTAQEFARTGHFVYNYWAAAMLGWQVPVSALGVKLFGFTFTAARLYTLPMTLIGAWLFYLILVGFDFAPRNAAFGTFALFLSMVCLPLEFTSMTDVPGLVVVIVCIFLCQRAVVARTVPATIAWLCLAAATNVVGGTVRQVAWLGALVMVPTTAWLLRRRRGVLAAGIVLPVLSVLAIEAMLIWFRHQPFTDARTTVPSKMFGAQLSKMAVAHLVAQLVRAFLSLQLLLLPLLLAWMVMAWKRGLRMRTAIVGVGVLSLAVFAALPHLGKHGRPETWLIPFSLGIVAALGLAPPGFHEVLGMAAVLPLRLRILLSALVVTAAFATLGFFRSYFSWSVVRGAIRRLFPRKEASGLPSTGVVSLASGPAMFWLLGPFLLVYLAFLVPLGLAGMLFDRYLMPVLAVAIILLLRLYEETIAPRVQWLSMAAMTIVALYAIAGTHDMWALYRGRVAAGNELMNAGIPRTEFQGGFDYDGQTQIEAVGYIVNKHAGIHVMELPEDCEDWFSGSTPAVHPQYFVMRAPVACFEPSHFADIRYRAWLPPFHRRVMIGKLREQYRGTPYITTDFKPLP
jgi:hypothetical protein